MLLWDIIRDFFVRYIFGGVTSGDEIYGGLFGNLIDNLGNQGNYYFDEIHTKIDNISFNGTDNYIYLSLPDYLSTTATIIVMVLLCFLLVKLAIWIFKLGANLIRLR